MKKTYIGLPLILVGLLLLIFFGIQITKLQRTKELKDRQMDFLPEVCLPNLTDSLVCTANLDNRPLVIIFFDSHCESCKQEINGLYKHKTGFSNTNIIMVTTDSKESCIDFSNRYKLHELPNLQILRDSTGMFMQMARVIGVPESLIYNNHKQLVKRFTGEVKATTLLEYIKQLQISEN